MCNINRLIEWKTDRGKQRGILLQFLLAESAYEGHVLTPHAIVEISNGRVVYIETSAARDLQFVESTILT